MHHYRQALLHIRQGDSDRDVAAAGIMGRRKSGHWCAVAAEQGRDGPTHTLTQALRLHPSTAATGLFKGETLEP
jgi:hypothetical protein